MAKFKVLTTPTRLKDLQFDNLDDGDESDWQAKSERLQARRWRKISELS